MSESPHDRRLAENEVVFRQHNEQIQKDFDNLDEISKSEGKGSFDYAENMVLEFMCECSNEKCTQRLPLALNKYGEIHQHRHRFTIVPGHERPKIEKIIEKTDTFIVVQKLVAPPHHASALNPT